MTKISNRTATSVYPRSSKFYYVLHILNQYLTLLSTQINYTLAENTINIDISPLHILSQICRDKLTSLVFVINRTHTLLPLNCRLSFLQQRGAINSPNSVYLATEFSRYKHSHKRYYYCTLCRFSQSSLANFSAPPNTTNTRSLHPQHAEHHL